MSMAIFFFYCFSPSFLFGLLRRPLQSRVISAFFVDVLILSVKDGNVKEVIML